MKKYLVIFLILAGCSKEKKVCWECDINCPFGGDRTEKICNDGETPMLNPTDGSGNQCGYSCQKI